MDSLILSANVVLPLFFMMALGYILKQLNFIDEYTISKMNTLVFKVFLPITLFVSIFKTDFRSEWDSYFILYGLFALFIYFFISIIIVNFLEKDNKKRGVLIQCAFRSNFILFGLPVAVSIYPDVNLGVVAMLIAIIVPIYNLLAVAILQYYSKKTSSISSMVDSIVKNPLIIASILGIMFSFVELPTLITKPLLDLSKIATPLALVLLGASFSFSSILHNLKGIFIGTSLKIVIFPAIFVTLAAALGFRNIQLIAFMTMFGSPAAVSSFTMAKQMGGDSELAGLLVVFTSVFSIVTMFIMIYILSMLKFI